MIQSPQFSSHAQQQALLGCAAKIDQHKHPRRYAALQAKQKVRQSTGQTMLERQRAAREQVVPKIRELAKTMCVAEVAREIGMGRKQVAQIGEEYFFEFAKKKPGPPKTLRDVAREYLDKDAADGS